MGETTLVERLQTNAKYLRKMMANVSFGGEALAITIKEPITLLEDLDEAAAELTANASTIVALTAECEMSMQTIAAERKRAEAAEATNTTLSEELAKRTDELAGCRDAMKKSTIEVAKLEQVRHDLNEMVLRYMARAETAEERVAVLEKALRDVCNPLAKLRSDAEAQGHKLSGAAYQIANDLPFVQSIARAALGAGQPPLRANEER